jgi:hypothetical protein
MKEPQRLLADLTVARDALPRVTLDPQDVPDCALSE